MPTRLYFHNASNTLSGTFPTTEQSTVYTLSWSATTSATLRTMDNRVGIAQASLAGTMLNNVNLQTGFMGYFCSPPLFRNQTVGGGTWRINVSDAESSLNANAYVNTLTIYIWRPSTGTKIGTIREAAALGGTEPTAINSQQVTTFTFTTSAISALKGDVIICEIWEQMTASMAGAYTCTFYFDGRTETLTENTVVSNHASFLQMSETIQFLEFAPTSVGHPFIF